MELKNLLDKPSSECSDEELEKRAHLLSRLRVAPDKSPSAPARKKTNKDHQMDDLIKGLSKEQLTKLLLKLKEENK